MHPRKVIFAAFLSLLLMQSPLRADKGVLTNEQARAMMNKPEPSKQNPDAPHGYMWVYWWHGMGAGKEKQLWQILLPTGKPIDNKKAIAEARQYVKDHWDQYVDYVTKQTAGTAKITKVLSADALSIALKDIDRMVSLSDADFDTLRGTNSPNSTGLTIVYTDPPFSYISTGAAADDNPDRLAALIAHEAFHAGDAGLGLSEHFDDEGIIYPFMHQYHIGNWLPGLQE